MGLALRTARARRPFPAGRRGRELGVSLVEVLLASFLFLAISLGVVPMFTQSMVSNSSGNDSTKASNFARARAEELMQLPFNHLDLTIEAGSEKTTEEYYVRDDGTWRAGPAPLDVTPEWQRFTTIRQYSVAALADDTIEVSEAMDAGTDPSLVQLKEIQVDIEQIGGLLTSSAKTITVRTFRSH